jgi:hypothetical protein
VPAGAQFKAQLKAQFKAQSEARFERSRTTGIMRSGQLRRWTMASGVRRIGLHLGWVGGLLFAGAVWFAARELPGYEHARHPVGLLGVAAAPSALVFNLVAYGTAGLAVAGFALALEAELMRRGLGRITRLATGMLLIAGLAFAAQGLLPLDPQDLDGSLSRRHAVAHAIALLAWLPSTALFALALWRAPALRGMAWLAAAFALALGGLLVWPATLWLPGWAASPGWAQRLLLLAWFLWPALLAVRLLRGDAVR